ncbi:MAG: hypothetical protein QOD32_969 [Pyrinomonadaceae bacterium]|jgi:hypothetical protein|nr:hypothetical protein [Pyrinomonadaceae bacterium]
MNQPILLLVMLLIIAVDVWSVSRADWLLFGMNTAVGLSLLLGLRKSETARRLQVLLFTAAAVIGVIRLASGLF